MGKKILITGASGFVGSHLVNYLLEKTEDDLFGTYFFDKNLKNLKKDRITFLKVDLRNEDETLALMERVKPDAIYHLAAFASAASSFKSPNETVINNISSQINILEAVRKSNLSKCRILIISSADIYGYVRQEDLPIDEETPFNPTNPYAVSKLTQDFLGKQYFLSYRFQIVRARPFNHIGPGQSPNFVVASFAQKIAEMEKGKREPVLPIGNVEVKRDFTDVRDVVRAYALLMEKGIAGEVYNVGAGISYKISDILDKLLSLTKTKIKVKVNDALIRPIDVPDLVCDPTKLRKLTGWKPEIPLEQTLEDTLDYWRNII
jgi:GDP-4-dehydro-6-deoxy-D-mannose reductase